MIRKLLRELLTGPIGDTALGMGLHVVRRLGRLATSDLHPRRWSNAELRRFTPYLDGDVVNVSGWRDADRVGGRYRDYFVRCRSYTITNYPGTRGLADGAEGSIPLDLEAALPEMMRSAFDVVFCHTVLEHVYDKSTAFMNLADMSRDLLILVVPFMQEEHFDQGSYGDYWRYTPMSLGRLTSETGMSLLYMSSNDSPWWPIYLFAVGSRNPEKWKGILPASCPRGRRIGFEVFYGKGSGFASVEGSAE
jgi:hypothetical protein